MFINNNVQLKQFYKECQKDKKIGVDTEFYWKDTYQPRLCLIQIATKRKIAILDPIVYDLDLKYIKCLLENPNILKVFHSAKQDIQIFFNLFNIIPKNIFDIQIGVLPLGFNNSSSLKEIVKSFTDRDLIKDYQYLDWRERPLKEEQIIYAENDVKYLLETFEKIIIQLKFFRRKSWINDLHKNLIKISSYRKENSAWKKINFNKPRSHEIKLLKQISKIREVYAKENNLVVKKIISDSDLLKLCKLNVPICVKKKIINKIDHEKFKDKIKSIKLEKNTREVTLNQRDERHRKKIKKLKKILLKKADILNIKPNVIANRKELEDLIINKNMLFFKGWKKKILDENIIKLIMN